MSGPPCLTTKFVWVTPVTSHDNRAYAVKTAYTTFSSQLMHQSDDGRLAKDQFVTELHARLDDSSRADVIEILSEALFNIADTARINEVSKAEFVDLAKAVGDAAPSIVWEAFNSDGVILGVE
ncbi:hypothetical protein ACIO6U_18635 [Streptomyces sp. NPDC087422]|uniref:hypothetical protein n=1 Tax=Streptomyces sp. NPDC087422 TaxID=3365786 RepID=UPI0038114ED8